MGLLLTCLLVVSNAMVPASEATVTVVGKEGRINHNLNGIIVGVSKPDISPKQHTIATVIPKKLQKSNIRFVVRVGNVEFTPKIWNVDMETGTTIMLVRDNRVNLPTVAVQYEKELVEGAECYLVYRNQLVSKERSNKTFRENIVYDKDGAFTEDSPKPSQAIGCGVFYKGQLVGLFGEDGAFIPASLIKSITEGESLK